LRSTIIFLIWNIELIETENPEWRDLYPEIAAQG